MCPPRAAVRQRRIALSAFRRCRSKQNRARSRYAGPAARMTSATSKGGLLMEQLCRLLVTERERVERAGGRLQVAMRKVQVNRGRLQVAMAHQKLDRPEIDTGFEQVGGERVAQRVRMDGLLDAGAASGLVAGVPDDLVADGPLGMAVPASAGEQPGAGLVFEAAPVQPELVQQLGAEHDIA